MQCDHRTALRTQNPFDRRILFVSSYAQRGQLVRFKVAAEVGIFIQTTMQYRFYRRSFSSWGFGALSLKDAD